MSGIQRFLVFKIVLAFTTVAAFFGLFSLGNPHAANAAWAVLALMALEKKVKGNEPEDERDKEILGKASLIGYGVFWVCFIFACVIVSVITSPTGTVPTVFFGFVPVIGYCLLEVVRSTAGLVFYLRGT